MKLFEIVNTLTLEPEKLNLYRNLASAIEADVESNLYLTPFELEKMTGISYVTWMEFMTVPEVNGWYNQMMTFVARAGQRKGLQKIALGMAATNDVNAYKALKEVNENTEKADNSNVVILYMPPTDSKK